MQYTINVSLEFKDDAEVLHKVAPNYLARQIIGTPQSTTTYHSPAVELVSGISLLVVP